MESKIEPLHPVLFMTSDGQLYEVDYRDIEKAMERDPEGRTMPGDGDELILTADDCVWLWMHGIGTGEE